MINPIWLTMILIGVVAAAASPAGIDAVTRAAIKASEQSVSIAFGLIGLMAFWSGMMRVAQEAGVTQLLARLLAPVGRRLFPSVPADDPAMGSILIALSANILGLGNAATPLGLRAMEDLKRLSPGRPEASDAMCTFLVLNTSGLTFIPGTVIALRAAHGSSDPTLIVGTTILATATSTLLALILDRLARGRHRT